MTPLNLVPPSRLLYLRSSHPRFRRGPLAIRLHSAPSVSLLHLGRTSPCLRLQTCWSSAPPAPHLILFVVLLPVVRPPCHPPPGYSACLPHPFTYSYLPSLYHILFILLSVGVFWEGVNCNNFNSIWTLFSVCTVSTVELVVMVYE